ncbi:MAG: hypothetical protein ABSH16_08475, partial [Sedimentisphaerales bacterium]
MNSSQGSHIKDVANVFSASEYARFAGESSRHKVKRSDADQSGDLLAVELPQFGQLRQEHSTSLRADAWGAAEDFIFFTEAVVGLDVLFNEFVEFGDLIVEGFEHLADAFTNLWMKGELASVGFLGVQVSELPAATHQVSQFVYFGACGRFWLWLDDLGETCKDCGVDGVGLGPFAKATCEVTDLSRGGDDYFEVCLKQFGDDWTFVSAGGFEDYQG